MFFHDGIGPGRAAGWKKMRKHPKCHATRDGVNSDSKGVL